jgi:hypothetical protein
MTTPTASTLVTLGIPGLALLVVALVGVAIFRFVDARRAAWYALGAGVWLFATGVLAWSGFLARAEELPPRFVIVMVPTFALPVLLGLSDVGKRLSNAPFALLIGFQAFRLPLELVMHQAAIEGTMPEQMSYAGMNFDIVTGATALVVAVLAARDLAPRWLLLAWNTLGTLLLLAIVLIAVASLPAFAAFGREPAQVNTWVAYFPFVWLPAGLVSSGVLGHVLLWRRLLSCGMRGRDFEAQAIQGRGGGSVVGHG